MKNWIIGFAATICVAGGAMLAWPNEVGRGLAGTAIIIAGLECTLYLMRQRKD